MHLWWENIIPDLVEHWRGRFFSETATANISATANYDADDESDPFESDESDGGTRRPSRPKTKRGRAPIKKGKGKTAKKKDSAAPTKKFVKTSEPYNIAPDEWTKIGKDMAGSAATFPTLFGEPIRDFTEHCQHLKAAEWRMFMFLLAPIYLRNRLPEQDYSEFINLVDTLQLGCDYEIIEGKITVVEERLKRFAKYYEDHYYNKRWERLPACLPVFHQILHVAQGINWAGPMFVYWQWPMEWVCGMIAASAKSRVSANRNMAISMALNEQWNHLPYVISATRRAEDEHEDSDGNVLLHRLFIKWLGPRLSLPSSSSLPSGPFTGPSKTSALNTWQRCVVKSYLTSVQSLSKDVNTDESLDTDMAFEDISKSCIHWASFTPATVDSQDSFTIVSSTMRRSNSTRNSFMIRYEVMAADGTLWSAYGEIIFFFSLELASQAKSHLAYVQRYLIEHDERLLFKTGNGLKEVIDANQVCELIGLIKNDGREYLMRRYSCFF